MKDSEAQKLKTETGMAPCWLVWEAASDGGRPYLVAIDTSEEQANLHLRAKREEASLLDKPPPQLRVEESWLDHLYGESMTKSFDEVKKKMKEVLRAQVADLKTRLRRAIDIARDAVNYSYHPRDAVNYSYHQRDSAQETLDELTKLEKIL
jgi:hypothetical protein